MKVSVVIPVYNAEKFIFDAVNSALSQEETGEILLIEDGSPDNSFSICQNLAKANEKIILLTHQDGKNHGAGASRNLGIKNAQYDYIAFLDADDIYLPNRFESASKIFCKDSNVHGVYDAIGIFFENEQARQQWLQYRSDFITTLTERVAPEHLFESQSPIGTKGYFSIDGLTVRKDIFDKTGLFDTLRLHQDTVMFVKMAALGNLMPGNIERPVALRRVHDQNRIIAMKSAQEEFNNRKIMWGILWQWSRSELKSDRHILILKQFLRFVAKPYSSTDGKHKNYRISGIRQILSTLKMYPLLSLEPYFWGKLIWVLLAGR